MKKLFALVLVFICLKGFSQVYNPSIHNPVTNKAVGYAQANSSDARSMYYDVVNFVYRDFQSTSEANTYLPLAKYRFGHFPVFIHVGGTLTNGVWTGGTTVVYYYKDGVLDANLVPMIPITSINGKTEGGIVIGSADSLRKKYVDTVLLTGTKQEAALVYDSVLGKFKLKQIAGGSSAVNSVSFTSPMINVGTASDPNVAIPNAAADGTTKGAAAFGASDFNAISGVITIDYTNGQTGNSSTKGFITAADWSTFNAKVTSVNGQVGVVLAKNADSILHQRIDSGLTIRNNYVIAWDSLNRQFYFAANDTASGGGGGAGGTVTNVSRTNGFGITASVSNPTTTPNITIAVDSASGLHTKLYYDVLYETRGGALSGLTTNYYPIATGSNSLGNGRLLDSSGYTVFRNNIKIGNVATFVNDASSTANTFSFQNASGVPKFSIINSSATANDRIWNISNSSSGTFSINATNDAGTVTSSLLTAGRLSGFVIDVVTGGYWDFGGTGSYPYQVSMTGFQRLRSSSGIDFEAPSSGQIMRLANVNTISGLAGLNFRPGAVTNAAPWITYEPAGTGYTGGVKAKFTYYTAAASTGNKSWLDFTAKDTGYVYSSTYEGSGSALGIYFETGSVKALSIMPTTGYIRLARPDTVSNGDYTNLVWDRFSGQIKRGPGRSVADSLHLYNWGADSAYNLLAVNAAYDTLFSRPLTKGIGINLAYLVDSSVKISIDTLSANLATKAWVNGQGFGTGSGGGFTTIGTFGSSPDAKGASSSGVTITMQPYDATHPGMMGTGSQTAAGAKTWTGSADFQSTTSFSGLMTTPGSFSGWGSTSGTPHVGIGGGTGGSTTSMFTIGGASSMSMNNKGVEGMMFNMNDAAVINDNSTSASGTVTHTAIAGFGNLSVSSTNATVTYTNASTVYIDGAPSASTNVTITNPWALYINAGRMRSAPNVSYGTTQSLTDGSTVTWNVDAGSIATVTIAGNRALAITNAIAGGMYTLKVIQGSGGSRTLTLPAGSKVAGNGAGAITLSTTAGDEDLLTVWYDGTNYYWNYSLDYN